MQVERNFEEAQKSFLKVTSCYEYYRV
jgi:hypothetical protein